MNLAPTPDYPRSTQAHRNLAAYPLLVALCVAAPLLGCGSSNTNKGAGASIVLKNENNYSSTSDLMLDNIDSASGQDLNVCWSELKKDLQCHDIDPLTRIKNISLVRFANTTHAEAQKKLISGNLSTGDVALYRDIRPDGASTCVSISSMKGIGGTGSTVVATDYVEKSTDTYVLIASRSITAGVGAQSMIFVTPLAGNATTSADIPTGCNELKFTANLHDLTPVTVPEKGPWIADWSQVTEDSENKDPNFVMLEYDLILGYYDKSVSDIEADFFNVETLAKKMWRVKNLSGSTTSTDLGVAQDAQGNLFTGFDQGDGIWALGLQCPECQNPAPLFLTIIKPGA